ncbi:MAG TPA: prephenate dehydrogenase, partial [Clostridia bacterium]|nr:prephenate dehydrogenase [Clostridia bacterium]
MVERITILGLGLIGGSWGMALKRTRPEIQITGVDVKEDTIRLGLETAAIDRGTVDLAEGVRDADLVIIATLVGTIPGLLRKAAPFLQEGCIVTDVGSTKEKIAGIVTGLLPPEVHYVGGHPMAGSEAHGLQGADSYLFENAVYILTPLPSTKPQALMTVEKLVRSVGARVMLLSPREHDQMVASVSHLPHIVAAALVNTVGYLEQEKPGLFSLAAGGFRDATRIAGSQPGMWRDIFLDNRPVLLPLIKSYRHALEEIQESIEAGNGDRLQLLLEQAQSWRRQIPAKIKGLLPRIYEIVVTVPDRPGIIGELAILLG